MAGSALGGCASLPSSGPTGGQIIQAAKKDRNVLGFRLVELEGFSTVDDANVDAVPYLPVELGVHRPLNLIGVGDGLEISIYEAGTTLFSGGSRNPGALTGSASAETLPKTLVAEDGFITVPFVGRIQAAGLTTTQLQAVIERGLAGKSQAPQVLVSIDSPVSGGVIISGEIVKSGRLPLVSGEETLSDVIALAGGYRGDASDLVVRLTRGGQTYQERMSALSGSALGQSRIAGGDRIDLARDHLSFSVFGGPGKVDEVSFGQNKLTLAAALAKAGGSSAQVGDPAAIFVFRFVNDRESGKSVPTIFHLDMTKTESYFFAQKFNMSQGDVLYVGNAQANQPSKMLGIIGQIFAPILTVRAVTQ